MEAMLRGGAPAHDKAAGKRSMPLDGSIIRASFLYGVVCISVAFGARVAPWGACLGRAASGHREAAAGGLLPPPGTKVGRGPGLMVVVCGLPTIGGNGACISRWRKKKKRRGSCE